MLLNGNFYRIIFQRPWKEQYDVQIAGTTTLTEMVNYGTFDIKGQFFDAYGLGIATYLSAVGNAAPIYICKRVESRNPPTMEDKPTLFIPARMVDEEQSITLKNSADYTITIGGLSRSLTPLAEANFLAELKQNIRERILTLDQMMSYPTTIEISSNPVLYEQPYLIQREIERSEAANNAVLSARQREIDENKRINVLLGKIKDYEAKTLEKSVLVDELLLQLNQVSVIQNNNILEATRLDRVRTYIIAIIAAVNGANPGTIPSFETLYAQAVTDLG